MILFTDSFDGYNTTYLDSKWRGVNRGSRSISTGGRGGGGCLRLNNAAVLHVPESTQTMVIQAFALWCDNKQTQKVCHFYGDDGYGPDTGNVIATLSLDSLGRVLITKGGTTLATSTATNLYQASEWHHYQVKINITAYNGGADTITFDAVVIVDGVERINETGLVGTSYYSTIGEISTYGPDNNAGMYFDDYYSLNEVSAAAGQPNNDFLGDLIGVAKMPNGAGNSAQFTPSSGSNYQCVDENPPTGDTDYVESSTLNHVDSHAFENVTLPSGASIVCVQNNVLARKTTAGSRSLAGVCRSNSTNYVGVNAEDPTDGNGTALGDTYMYIPQVLNIDPNAADTWTESAFNSAEFGYKVTV